VGDGGRRGTLAGGWRVGVIGALWWWVWCGFADVGCAFRNVLLGEGSPAFNHLQMLQRST